MAKQFNISIEDARFIRIMILRAAVSFDRFDSDVKVVCMRVYCDSLAFECIHLMEYLGPAPSYREVFESISNRPDKSTYYEAMIAKRPIPKIDKNLKEFCEKNIGDFCRRKIKIFQKEDGSLIISNIEDYKNLKSKMKSSSGD